MKTLRDLFAEHTKTALYHGTPQTIKNWVLNPHRARSVFGEEGTFIFATNDPLHSIAYSLKRPEHDLLNLRILAWTMREASTVAVYSNREALFKGGASGTIFKINAKTFKALGLNEWVSETKVPIEPANSFLMPGVELAMAFGLQIFCLANGVSKDVFQRSIWNTPPARMNDFITPPRLIWENRERGFMPRPAHPSPSLQAAAM